MKKIIRLTESDLHGLISRSVKRILREDVLGNDWNVNNEDENNVFNNYEPFESQKERYEAEEEFKNSDNYHDWSIAGEELDPTEYEDVYDTNDYEDEPSDGDLYRHM